VTILKDSPIKSAIPYSKDSPNPYLPTYQYQSNLTNITNLTESIEGRKSVSFHIRPSISKAFRVYCRAYPNKYGGELVEEAFITFMENNPLNNINLSIVNLIKTKREGAQKRLMYKRLTQLMTDKMNNLDAIQISGRGNYDIVKEELGKLVDKAVEIEIIDEDFETLLERAETYFD